MTDLMAPSADEQPPMSDLGRFRIGDVVRNGSHVATVTDVGTVLIAIRTAVGAVRMVCPWELVQLRAASDGFGAGASR